MGKRVTKRKKSDFKISDRDIQVFEGGEAELETDYISKVYIENGFYEQAKDFKSNRTFFVARTGIGKSAILEKIKNEGNYSLEGVVRSKDELNRSIKNFQSVVCKAFKTKRVSFQ